jgi:AraC-like DNA-binding protein
MAYQAHPINSFEGHRILLSVVHYFSEHYSHSFTIPRLSRDLGVSLIHIETAFDRYKGKAASQALLDYRLSRLCDLMSREPAYEIGGQLKQCGLALEVSSDFEAFRRTNEQFITCFGIDLIEYHQQCCLAEIARLQRNEDQRSQVIEPLVGVTAHGNQLLTRFHQSA